ncbi:hypothetical protein FRC04_011235 [Tulasnella sp. 424]|nr:hypothetical protein FRC04_011235 [Tulasnella sp. 424]KAG8971768.1 hypothetical protein FRC05_010835 [Tulasnella sp. 425]
MQEHSIPTTQIVSSNRSDSAYKASEAGSFLNFLELQDIWQDFNWERLFGNLKEDQIQVQRQESWFQIGGHVSKQYGPFCDWVERLIEVITSFTQLSTWAVRFKGLGNTLFLNTPGYADGEISTGFARDPNCERLLDFDLSNRIGSSSGAPHWTGTLPFMPIELLKHPNAEHQLGFDVEALSWTLLWIVRVYANGKEAHGKKEHPLMGWVSNRYELGVIANIKAAYLERPRGYTTEWYRELEPEIKSLAHTLDKMRRDLVDKRQEEDNDLLLPESIYGAAGFEKIKAWMADNRWDKPRESCPCNAHCNET